MPGTLASASFGGRSASASYFELQRRQPRTQDSTEDVSPLSGPAATPPSGKPYSKRPQLLKASRSRSDNSYQRTRVNVIEENVLKDHASSSETSAHISSYLKANNAESQHTSIVDSKQNPSDTVPKFTRPNASSKSRPSSSEAVPGLASKNQRITPRWSKSLARNSWAGRASSSMGSLSPFYGVRGTSSGANVQHPSIQALRPPSAGAKPSTFISEHRITVETPFTDAQTPQAKFQKPDAFPGRATVVNPRHLFSMPVSVLRKMKSKNNDAAHRPKEFIREHSKLNPMFAKDHMSNLRKQHTTNLLLRATSALQGAKYLTLANASDQTLPASSLRKATQHRSDDPGKYPVSLARVKSMELSLDETESQSSSLAELRMGRTPYHTPDEEAKYTIVNQQGEAEEFFKVDISVRGHTSYLPSEARRIHTPPLPGDDPVSRRRGFFFDYNLPSTTENYTGKQANIKSDKAVHQQHETVSKHNLVSPVPTISKQFCTSPAKNGHKVKPGDWYSAQLADIDALAQEPLDSQSMVSQPVSYPQDRMASCFDSVLQQVQEAGLDYNIPEHLPNSPLCPRHPRYWRVVKSKGSQFRGCWMHGIGESGDKDRAKYGIVVKKIIL